MKKDVIYIDIEDDITGIISKVKNAAASVVALVPPKRIGALQSVVNLKLLQKAAAEAGKRIVLISNDHSLMALAAGVRIPLARNLQSRPEIPDIAPPAAEAEEIINGADLPVGDIAGAMAKPKAPESLADQMSSKIDLSAVPETGAATESTGPKVLPNKPDLTKLPKKVGVKLHIPDFGIFRKRLVIFGGLGVLLVVFLVWAIAVAPQAKITISAKTIGVNVDRTLSLEPALPQSAPDKLAIKPHFQQVKKAVAAEFDATGTKDVGDKATGTIRVKNCDSTDAFVLAAGTTFSSAAGLKFTSNAGVTVPGFTGSANACRNQGVGAGIADAAVTAADLGPEYNIDASAFTISGVSGDVYANSSEAMAGGTREKATVVSQQDVDKAKEQLSKPNQNEAKAELKKLYNGDYIIIEESFLVEEAAPAVNPAVGEKAQRAKVTVETTFTIIGLLRSDVRPVLTAVVDAALKDKADQQQYSLGENTIAFQSFQKLENGNYTTRLITIGYVGPKIDTGKLAKQLAGKRYGEIEALINQIPGVDKVEIQLSPFWVSSAPSAEKIDISFSVANAK